MMTRRMRVREARHEDLPAIYAIMALNGMEGWIWPEGMWGAVAILDEHIVAFCAGHEVSNGILIEDLWCEPSHDGLRGLASVADWCEEMTAWTAREKGLESMRIGGCVLPQNERHRRALIKRGYSHHAEVLSKQVSA